MSDERMSKRSRWIVVGTVKADAQLWGWPWRGGPQWRGWWINWRGQRGNEWCQPNEFLEWEHLLAAVRNRLGLAGLQMVKISDEWRVMSGTQKEFRELRVLVVRSPKSRV
jgi:hypothetical protein